MNPFFADFPIYRISLSNSTHFFRENWVRSHWKSTHWGPYHTQSQQDIAPITHQLNTSVDIARPPPPLFILFYLGNVKFTTIKYNCGMQNVSKKFTLMFQPCTSQPAIGIWNPPPESPSVRGKPLALHQLGPCHIFGMYKQFFWLLLGLFALFEMQTQPIAQGVL